jgi:hypothetical protein
MKGSRREEGGVRDDECRASNRVASAWEYLSRTGSAFTAGLPCEENAFCGRARRPLELEKWVDEVQESVRRCIRHGGGGFLVC